jgi:hypothetical protein
LIFRERTQPATGLLLKPGNWQLQSGLFRSGCGLFAVLQLDFKTLGRTDLIGALKDPSFLRKVKHFKVNPPARFTEIVVTVDNIKFTMIF